MAMNMISHILILLAEECAEVAQRCTKAVRFGLDESKPGETQSNALRLLDEFEDLQLIHDMLYESGYFHEAHDAMIVDGAERRRLKREKIKKHIEISRSLGLVAGGYWDGNASPSASRSEHDSLLPSHADPREPEMKGEICMCADPVCNSGSIFPKGCYECGGIVLKPSNG